MSDVHAELMQVASDDASSKQDVMKATSKAMSLAKGYIDDLQLSKSMPSHLQRILETTSNQITKAEKHMKEVEGFVSRFSLDGRDETDLVEASKKSSTNRRKLLSRNQSSSAKYHFNRGVSKADYHMRATSRHSKQLQHRGLPGQGQFNNHQQGFHGARASRQEGRAITYPEFQGYKSKQEE